MNIRLPNLNYTMPPPKTGAPSNATTVGPTYTAPVVSSSPAEEQRVADLSSAIATSTKNLPQTADSIRNALVENDAITPQLSSQYSEAIRQLYEHDKALGDRYSQPTGDMYIENPVDRERAIQASRGAMVGNLGHLGQLIGTRRQVLGDAAQRGLEIVKAGIAAQQLELDAAEKALERAQKTKSQADDRAAEERWNIAKMNLEAMKEGSTFDPATGTFKKTSTSGALTDDAIKNSEKLRTEYLSQSKVNGFVEVKNSYDKVKNAPDNAAGDLSLIFGYMKMLDPASTVREGEFANAQNSTGVPDKIKNWYNKVLTGQRLGSQQRSEFKANAAQIFNSHVKTQKGLYEYYSGQASSMGLDPNSVVGIYGEIKEEPIVTTPPPTSQGGFLDFLFNPMGKQKTTPSQPTQVGRYVVEVE